MHLYHLEAMTHEIEQAARQRSAEARWRDPERSWLTQPVVAPAGHATGHSWRQRVGRWWPSRGGQQGRAEAARPASLHNLVQG